MMESSSQALRGAAARSLQIANELEPQMASEFREKLLTIGHLSHGQTSSYEQSGHAHPESGKPWKAVTDELGNTVTEHSDPGSGVSCRQDVEIRPDTIRKTLGLS